ncbi:MAG: PQQ-binding-like beta-propeller repeat protein [Burkholderiales bacterium]
MVLKYSPDGTLLWTHTEVRFKGHWDSGVVDAAGDIYLTGKGGSFSYLNTTQKLSGSTGATMWSNSPTANNETAGDIRLTLNGQVVVSSAAGPNGLSLYAYAADTGATMWSTRYAEAQATMRPAWPWGPRAKSSPPAARELRCSWPRLMRTSCRGSPAPIWKAAKAGVS